MLDSIFGPFYETLSRRKFLLAVLKGGLTAGGAGTILPPILQLGRMTGAGSAFASDELDELLRFAPRARFWVSTTSEGQTCQSCHPAEAEYHSPSHQHEEEIIKCLLCSQECLIQEGQRGLCRARINLNGELRSLVYGRPVSVHIDPIEKKPLYHFLPGSQALSISTAGCPLTCKFCQNWELSQARPEDFNVPFTPPHDVSTSAERNNVPVIAFTYNEPTVFVEYLTDVARDARNLGIRSVLISCGFMTEAPLTEMCDVLDAIKIDLKGFSKSFYRDVCGADLNPVLRSIRQVAKSGTHLEIVNLVVPTLNDSDPMLNDLSEWIMNEIGPDVPIHFTRFHPDFQMRNLPPTPVATLERARDIAMSKGIRYAFVGNVPGHPGNNTYCPKCGKPVIERKGFFIHRKNLENGCCQYCKEPVAGVWS